jgi:cytidine deaminase
MGDEIMFAKYDDYNTVFCGDDRNPYTPCGNCGADCKDFDLDENGVCADCADEVTE